MKACRDGEVQALWKKGITMGVHGNWLRVESSEFQPRIDLEALKYLDLAECSLVEDNNSLRNPMGNGLVEPNPSLTDQALIKASKVWEQMQQRVSMDQSENWVESLEAAAGMERTVIVQQCDVEASASVKRLSLHFENAKTSHPSVSGTQAVKQLDLFLIEPIFLNLVKSISGAPPTK